MKRLYFILVLIIACGFSFKTFSQINVDSLQKEILKSVQQYAKGKKYNTHFDSSNFFLKDLPGNLDSIFKAVNKTVAKAKSMGDIDEVKGGYYNLSAIDSIRGNYKGAYENYKLYSMYRDSLQKKELEQKELQAKMQRAFDKKQAQQQLEKEKEDRKNAMRLIFLIAFLVALITISTTFFIAYKREQKAKKLLGTQKEEIEDTLTELKATQAQLIHAEKMASLGELTAGIAHEIQNPLNFVNNFSEVNKEMIAEMKEEIDKGNYSEVKLIATNIEENEQKINHHGKRADTIVKSMLQHSRQTKGVKEPTDINALCDEYLRLSYHGLRAKDKSFNADFKTDFDETIGKINIVAQDIGRVLLNLFNNAFYATNEKRKSESMHQNAEYKPSVSVQTKRINSSGIESIEICVSDNGNGIPQNLTDKIFQPFFTTKPTGEGTGLGLSLSYDIITQQHNGTIRVESEEGEGTTFTINLPLS